MTKIEIHSFGEENIMRRLFIVRKDLHMSPGKLAAQIAHCTEAFYTQMIKENMIGRVEATTAKNKEGLGDYVIDTFRIPGNVYEGYINGRFVKTICQARNKNQLIKAKALAEECGLAEGKDFGFIYDACFTELAPEEEDGTCLTCFWTVPLPDDVAHRISKKYHLYTDTVKDFPAAESYESCEEANESSVRLIDANALLRRIQEYIDSDLTSTEEKIGADYCIEFVQNAETVLRESEG